jgi:hypothetical protein
MKTLKSLIFVAALAIASGANAKDNEVKSRKELDVKIMVQNDGKVLVGFEKLADDKVAIKIYNQAGELVHSEKVKDITMVLKRFDLSHLPSGKYTYTVSNDEYSVSKILEKK